MSIHVKYISSEHYDVPISLESNIAINDAQYHILILENNFINKVTNIHLDGKLAATVSLGDTELSALYLHLLI